MTAVCPCRAAAPVDAGAAEYIAQVERQAADADQKPIDPTDPDPGHVRTLAHYRAMLAEIEAEK